MQGGGAWLVWDQLGGVACVDQLGVWHMACVDQLGGMACACGSAGVCGMCGSAGGHGMCGSDENALLTLQVVLVLLSSTQCHLPVYTPAGGVACGGVLYALYMHLLGAWLVGCPIYMPCICTCWGRGLWGVLYALYMHLLGA